MSASISSTGVAERIWIPDKDLLWVSAKLIRWDEETSTATCELAVPDSGSASAQTVEVAFENTHPVDPSHLTDLDNLCLMSNLHEAPLLSLLRTRFFNDKIYTFTSTVLISINPYRLIAGLYDRPLRYLLFGPTLAATRARVSSSATGTNIDTDADAEEDNSQRCLRAVAAMDRIDGLVQQQTAGTTLGASKGSVPEEGGEDIADLVAGATPQNATAASLPPHVYEIANEALQALILTSVSSAPRKGSASASGELAGVAALRDQSIIISGESGAGKTENCKHVMNFLIQANRIIRAGVGEGEAESKAKQSIQRDEGAGTGTDDEDDNFARRLTQVLLESSVVLEAFGNAQTVRNDNSSRFGKYIKLQYDYQASPSATTSSSSNDNAIPQLQSACTETFLLEKSRLVSVGAGERNYHFFYQLLACLPKTNPQLCAELGLLPEGAAAAVAAAGEDQDMAILKRFSILQPSTSSSGQGSKLASSGVKDKPPLPPPPPPGSASAAGTAGTSSHNDEVEFGNTMRALQALRCSEEEVEQLLRLLACVLHLGNISCLEASAAADGADGGGGRETSTGEEHPSGRGSFGLTIAAQGAGGGHSDMVSLSCSTAPMLQVAKLLGVENPESPSTPSAHAAAESGSELQEQLVTALTTQQLRVGNRTSLKVKILSVDAVRNNLHALIKWLYSRLFGWLVRKINIAHAGSHSAVSGSDGEASKGTDPQPHGAFIGILDIFGFEILQTNSFEQLCINLANECLQQQFNESVFVMEQDLYRAEGLQWSDITFRDNQHVIDVICQPQPPKMGLLLILEEHSLLGRKPDDLLLLSTFNQTHDVAGGGGGASSKAKGKPASAAEAEAPVAYMRARFGNDSFVVKHFAGDVSYSVWGFLEKNNDSLQEDLLQLLERSTNAFLRNALLVGQPDPEGPGYTGPTGTTALASASADGDKSEAVGAPVDSPVAAQSPPQRRGGRQQGGGGSKQQKIASSVSVSLRFRRQLDELMTTLRSTRPHYIKCIKPNGAKQPQLLEAALVMQQLRYSGVLEVVRIRREGFPIRLRFLDFYRNYEVLLLAAAADLGAHSHRHLLPPPTPHPSGAGSSSNRFSGSTYGEDGRTAEVRHAMQELLGRIPKELLHRGAAAQRTHRRTQSAELTEVSGAASTEATGSELARDCAALIAYFVLPRADFQLGRSLIFLRDGCFHRLQVATRRVLHGQAAKIQALVRAVLGTKHFQQTKRRFVRLQAVLRQHAVRKQYKHTHDVVVQLQRFCLSRLLRARFLRHYERVKRERCVAAAVQLQRRQRGIAARSVAQHRKAACVTLQTCARGFVQRGHFAVQLAALVKVQACARMLCARRVRRARLQAAVRQQAVVRRFLLRCRFRTAQRAVVLLQRHGRGLVQRRRYASAVSAAVLLQKSVRGMRARILRERRLLAAVSLQSVARMRLARVLLVDRRGKATTIASWVRRWLHRRRFAKQVWAVRRLQRLARAEKMNQALRVRLCALHGQLQRRLLTNTSGDDFGDEGREKEEKQQSQLQKQQSQRISATLLSEADACAFLFRTFTARLEDGTARNPWLSGPVPPGRGPTVLHSAVLGGSQVLVRYILGLSPNAKDVCAMKRSTVLSLRASLTPQGASAAAAAAVAAAAATSSSSNDGSSGGGSGGQSAVEAPQMAVGTAGSSGGATGDRRSRKRAPPPPPSPHSPQVLFHTVFQHHRVLERDLSGRTSAHYLAQAPRLHTAHLLAEALGTFARRNRAAQLSLGVNEEGVEDEDDPENAIAAATAPIIRSADGKGPKASGRGDGGQGAGAGPGPGGRPALQKRMTVAQLIQQEVKRSRCLIEGELKKKRQGLFFMRRWFVLTEDHLVYYTNQAASRDGEPRFAIPLDGCEIRRVGSAKEPTIQITTPFMAKKKGGFFGTTNAKNTTMNFIAADEQELQHWLLLLRAVAGVQSLREGAGGENDAHYVHLVLRRVWLSAVDCCKETPLHVLVRGALLDCMPSTGAARRERQMVDETSTAAQVAAQVAALHEAVKVAAWMVEFGCAVNAVNVDGDTALHLAITAPFRIAASGGAVNSAQKEQEQKQQQVNQVGVQDQMQQPLARADATGERLRAFHVQLVRCLLIKGADVTTVRNRSRQRTAMDELQCLIRESDSQTPTRTRTHSGSGAGAGDAAGGGAGEGGVEEGARPSQEVTSPLQDHLNNLLGLLLPHAASAAFSEAMAGAADEDSDVDEDEDEAGDAFDAGAVAVGRASTIAGAAARRKREEEETQMGPVQKFTGYSYLSMYFADGFYPQWSALGVDSPEVSRLLIKVSVLNAKRQEVEPAQVSHVPICRARGAAGSGSSSSSSGSGSVEQVEQEGVHWGWGWHMHTPLENLPPNSVVLIEVLLASRSFSEGMGPGMGAGIAGAGPAEEDARFSVDSYAQLSSAAAAGGGSAAGATAASRLHPLCCWGSFLVDNSSIDSGEIQCSLHAYPVRIGEPHTAGVHSAQAFLDADVLLSRKERHVDYRSAMEDVHLV